ncbi:nucleotidyltransferase family protein [Collinsella stercoris]|uniref:nucleotidyltransferase family protein n=1 Tax=Collinsella stercoris TaxID=147206 RepID=UPI00248DECEA|nr:nucleotidyltransferase domain-containing protein [Collinsella stercoris]
MVAVEDIYEQMRAIAKEEGAERLVLFGSRARGTNFPKSDFDIAVAGCPSFNRLADRFENELWTLLDVDVVNLDVGISPELRAEIERDGKVLYEKIR